MKMVIGFALVCVLFLGACTSQGITGAAIADEQPADEAPALTLPKRFISTPTQTIKEFDITATNSGFEPGNIVVKEGETVRLNVVSSDGNKEVAIGGLGVQDATIQTSEPVSIEFVADSKGSHEIICESCGFGNNAMGIITVE
jgi:heme/copper-type cytochrome/quinol oxidase subunit 2